MKLNLIKVCVPQITCNFFIVAFRRLFLIWSFHPPHYHSQTESLRLWTMEHISFTKFPVDICKQRWRWRVFFQLLIILCLLVDASNWLHNIKCRLQMSRDSLHNLDHIRVMWDPQGLTPGSWLQCERTSYLCKEK